MSERLTLPQVRARLIRAAMCYSHEELCTKLALTGYNRPIPPFASLGSLAHRLAWHLLPAGPDRDALGDDLSADLSVSRQRF